MNILGIETSCDETAAAVVKDGREVLSNVVYTQIPLHQPYGGVVPEIASRAHVEKIGQVVRAAIESFRVGVGSDRVGIGFLPKNRFWYILFEKGKNDTRKSRFSTKQPGFCVKNDQKH